VPPHGAERFTMDEGLLVRAVVKVFVELHRDV
jgi:valyl-tRNA synthetase